MRMFGIGLETFFMCCVCVCIFVFCHVKLG
jgi:hypothetical protein